MIGDKIVIRLINRSHEKKLIEKTLIDIEYVEQLVHSILQDEKVKPVCRNLFGLQVVGQGTWLAPNVPFRSIIEWSNRRRLDEDAKLEIRVRFRPACFKLVSFIDKAAFDIIFAQILHDFMRTRFNDEDRDLVLLNDSVLILVALNLVRYSIEHGININEIIQRVDLKDFIPKRVSRWQRTVLSWLSDPMNLQKSLKIGIEQFDNDLHKIKRKFIEIFLTKVAPEYLAESHIAQLVSRAPANVSPHETAAPARIRVRYGQTQEDSECLIEACNDVRPKKTCHRSCKQSKSRDVWNVMFDIETISHATLNECDVQIVGLKSEPVMLRFFSTWEARSFLSSIDGYQRLMKKWAFNLCPQVFSPELKYLNEIGCHGPIGCATSARKLIEHKRPGGYLIRRCMDLPNLYLIDTLIMNRILLTIDIEWDPSRGTFRKTEHSANSKQVQVSVRTDREYYNSLRSLVEGTEIRLTYESEEHRRASSTFQQLKHMIRPKESDNYPALTLSMSRRKIKRGLGGLSDIKQSINQLPRLIPQQLLDCCSSHKFRSAGNGLSVELAFMNGDQEVVLKKLNGSEPDDAEKISCAFHYCPHGHMNSGLLESLRPSQMRVADWMFVDSDLFAETIGYVISGAIVQEYFPLGSLDVYLSRGAESSQMVLLSASLQIAQALMFLCDQKIIHGKIRCRNVMVKQERPIQIKLTDPLGSLDPEQDQAFIPPEYFSSSIQACVKEFYSGIDVWAVGTTIWQIFNHGISPPSGRYANTLTQTPDCPDKMWMLIESCWMIEPNFRTPPRTLYRDIFDLIAWEKGSHNYFHISQHDSSQDQQESIPHTAGSSVSDLTTLHTANSSHLSSPISMSTNGSQMDLLKRQSNGLSPPPKHQSSTSGNPMSSYLPSIKRPNWASLIHLKRNMKRCQLRDDLPPHQRLSSCDSSRSRLSLTCSSNGSTSDVTRSTDALDLQSISEAVDKCVWHVEMSRLRLAAQIGRGSSGVVSKGFLSQLDGQEQVVAVKSIEKDGPDPIDAHRAEDLKREFDILKNLDHPNIVKALGYVESAQIMLIFEYMPLGSLLSCVRNLACHGDLAELPLRKYALDIANGMEYLESKKIVHRDLALRNILLKSRNEVKICDFGLAQSLGTSNHYKLETDRALPVKWYAPETLDTWVFTHKSDVWSYGVVLWEIYSGGDSPQYSGSFENLSDTLKHERLAQPTGCPEHMYNLMLGCWVYDPQDRRSFKQIRESLELTK